MEKYSAYRLDAVAEIRQASEGVGKYAGGLSLALLGVNPETLDNQRVPYSTSAILTEPERYEMIPDAVYLKELSRTEALKRLSRLSLNGSVETFNKSDLS